MRALSSFKWLRAAVSRPPSPAAGARPAMLGLSDMTPHEYNLGATLSRQETVTTHAPLMEGAGLEKRTTLSAEMDKRAIV